MSSVAHLIDFRFFIAFETDGQTIVLSVKQLSISRISLIDDVDSFDISHRLTILFQTGLAQNTFAQKGLTQNGLTQNGLTQNHFCAKLDLLRMDFLRMYLVRINFVSNWTCSERIC
jgi:hypothetical protein